MKKLTGIGAVFAAVLFSGSALGHGGGYVTSGAGVDVIHGFGGCVIYGSGPDADDQCGPDKTPEKKPAPAGPADSDGDGVVDSKDRCPNTPAGVKVNWQGCPLDSDNDGVPDYQDSCPDTAAGAKVDAKGCYIILKESREVELNVIFATNSAVVAPEYFPEIKAVADFMKEFPLTKVVVEGHTDDRGAASYNKQLSQRRADAVAAVLTSRYGVAADRVSSVGYGEERPAVPNTTRENLKKNRRVIAVVSTTVDKIAK